MNRKWRYLRNLLWLAVFVAVVAVGAVGFRGFHHENAMKAHGQQQQQLQGFAKSNENAHFQGQAEIRDGHGAREHRGFDGGGLVALLGSLVLVIAGWKLWKHAGRKGRWIGGLLIALALLPLVVPALLIYLIYRILRRPTRIAEPMYVATTESYPSTAVDTLDAWEAKTRRELKNKEEK
ncbi:hypothetical protein [Tumebacillus permanentifrigoris]|uniref:Uncharacterized protein n=1 Tax=Tumebacillus permanentifrigoris TaxID=378543 RepID=A0A316DDW1_9BACL|nr:hypothetical protein [Tumebacillus permanentifrigoris]PWK14980.1 hypothetical protein C7459_104184 [Tumebacillus permanentifrigoris]